MSEIRIKLFKKIADSNIKGVRKRMKRKILMLGGCGFLGANLATRLVANNEDVYIFELPTANTRNIDHILKHVKLIRGDFSSNSDLEQAVKGMDIVVHLISTTTAKNSTDDPVFDITTNIVPSVNLLQLAVKHGVSRIIYPSSGGTIYGPTECDRISEDHKTEPISSYGIHKLTVEKYLALFHYMYGLDYRILRFSNPYGAMQWGSLNQGIIGVYCQLIVQGKCIEVWGDGSATRDYLYIEDAADAFIKAIDTTSSYRLFNIGSGIGTSINEIVNILREISNKPFEVAYTPGRRVDVSRNVLDPSLAIGELDWRPTIGIKEGIKLTFDWFAENQALL